MGKFLDSYIQIIEKYLANLRLIEDSANHKAEEKIDDQINYELSVFVARDENEKIYFPKIQNLFRVLCSELTDEEFKDVEIKIAEIKGKDYLKNYIQRIVDNSKEFKGRDASQMGLKDIYNEISSGFFQGTIDYFINHMVNLIGEERLEKLTERIETYDPFKENAHHDFESIINNAKDTLKNDEKISDEEKQKLENLLNDINEEEYVSHSQSDLLANSCDKLICKRLTLHNGKYIKDNNLDELYIQIDNDIEYKPEVIDNEDLIAKTIKYKFDLNKNYKQNLINVYNKMESLGLLDNEFIFEQGIKIYGFRHFYLARRKLQKAIEEKDFKNLAKLKEDYTNEHNKLREIYKYIKETINPNLLTMPGNMTNYRTSYVPDDLAHDLPVNASLNGFYYVFSSIKAANIKIEDYVENPILNSKKIVDTLYSEHTVDNAFANISREEKIMRLYSLKNYTIVRFTFRFVENVVCHEPEFNEKNAFLYSLFVSTDDKNTGVNCDYADYYMFQESSKTLLNLIVTKDDNIEFSKLHGEDILTRDALHTVKAFDIKTYIETHELNVIYLIDYSKSLLAEYIKLNDTGILDLYGNRVNDSGPVKNYEMMLTEYYKSISLALVDLTNYKSLGIKEYDYLYEFLKNPAEAVKDYGFSQKELNKLQGNTLDDEKVNKARQNQKFYKALDEFNLKYDLDLSVSLLKDVKNIDFDQNKFFSDKFIECFNNVYSASNNNPKTFTSGKLLTDKDALFDFVNDLNNLCTIGINDYLNNKESSPLETMTNEEKVKMFEDAFGLNRILDVKANGISYRDKNKSGFSNLNYKQKANEFYTAYETINNKLKEFDENKEYLKDTKKVFLQSYREVYQTMNNIHNNNWFIKMIIHNKDYKHEKKMLDDTLNLVASKLRVEKDVVKQYFNKKTDVLRSGSRQEYINNPENTKSYDFDNALMVSNTITSVVCDINNKYNLANNDFDIIMREEKDVNLDLNQRKNIEVNDLNLENGHIEPKNIENEKDLEIDVKK